MISKKYFYINKYILGLFLIIVILIVSFLKYNILLGIENLKQDEIDSTKEYAQNIITYIKKRVPNQLHDRLENNISLQKELNIALESFLTDKYQYIFILKRKNGNEYRFILDGSQEDKKNFNNIFIGSDYYNEVYSTKDIVVKGQLEDVENVWMSIFAPIIYDDSIEGILELDLSKDYVKYIENINSPLLLIINSSNIIFLLLLFILLFIYYISYRYERSIKIDSVSGALSENYLNMIISDNIISIDSYYSIMIDIDEFRMVNSNYGYTVGTILLKSLVNLLNENIKKEYDSEYIFHKGSGVFVILIRKDKDNLEDIVKYIFKLVTEYKFTIEVDNNKQVEFQIGVSMSAINTPSDVIHIYKLWKVLDEHILDVKKRGKNNFSIVASETRNILKYSSIDTLRKLISEEAIICEYQPIFKLNENGKMKIVKFETLVRLYDKSTGVILYPGNFFDTIRSTSLYIKLTRLVLERVFFELQNRKDVSFSVNLNLDDLYNKPMMLMLEDVLFKHKEYASRLTFEILEDLEIFDYDRVNKSFSILRKFGCKIAIDDFGSGFSNYIYMIKLDVDFIKIDANIVKELLTNQDKAKKVIESINNLANSLNLEVIVEYVDNREIYDQLVPLGIKYYQGFYIGKPKNIREYLD